MAATEHQTLIELGEERGWARRDSGESGEVFTNGTVRIRVNWAGEQLTGATLFHNGMYESYTREPSTVSAWLKR